MRASTCGGRSRRSARRRGEQLPGLPRDLEILARLDDEDARPDAAISVAGVQRLVELDAEVTEARAGACADRRRALADAAGEHERIDSSERGDHRADLGV